LGCSSFEIENTVVVIGVVGTVVGVESAVFVVVD
jgi:hypothetical protein